LRTSDLDSGQTTILPQIVAGIKLSKSYLQPWDKYLGYYSRQHKQYAIYWIYDVKHTIAGTRESQILLIKMSDAVAIGIASDVVASNSRLIDKTLLVPKL